MEERERGGLVDVGVIPPRKFHRNNNILMQNRVTPLSVPPFLPPSLLPSLLPSVSIPRRTRRFIVARVRIRQRLGEKGEEKKGILVAYLRVQLCDIPTTARSSRQRRIIAAAVRRRNDIIE